MATSIAGQAGRHRGGVQHQDPRPVVGLQRDLRSGRAHPTPAGWRWPGSRGGKPERSGRHSRPSKVESTGPRKYRSGCCGGAPSKRMRMAMLSSSARLAMLPTCMLADSPLRPLIASAGMPHSGASRGNSTNSTAMTGAPSSAIQPAVRAAVSSGGLPTGMWALTSAVSRPSSATSMAAAVSSDWREEEVGEHREEAQEEDHERVAPGPQLQRLERQQHHDQRHARVAAQQRAVGATAWRRW